jgi:hypothetical protein
MKKKGKTWLQGSNQHFRKKIKNIFTILRALGCDSQTKQGCLREREARKQGPVTKWGGGDYFCLMDFGRQEALVKKK